MSLRLKPAEQGVTAIATIGLIWVVLALLASDGLYNVDELIYVAAAEAFADRGALTIVNGYREFRSDALRLYYLVPCPDGLAPQYPSGFPIIAAPLVRLFGQRGFLLLNTLAAVGALFVTRSLALTLYDDRLLANMAALILATCTFLLEYGLGIRPHALSVLIVVTAALLTVKAVQRQARRSWGYACLAGLAVGLGILIRVDTILVVPPLTLWLGVFAPRPLRLLLSAAIGMLPGLTMATALNWAKFGVAMPLSYGAGRSGGVDPFSYWPLAIGLAGSACLVFLIRSRQWPRRLGLSALVMVGVVGTLALLFVTGPDSIVAVAHGIYSLLIDFGDTTYLGFPVVRQDGSVASWSYIKKALGQSLPWLSIVLLIVVHPWRQADRRGHALCLMTAFLWMLPFLQRGWHGGFGTNMRYFLPILPCLCILAAAAWRDLRVAAMENFGSSPWGWRPATLLAITSLAGIYIYATITASCPLPVFAQHKLSNMVLAVLAASVLVSRMPGRLGVFSACASQVVFIIGLILASALANLVDLPEAQRRRAHINQAQARYAAAPAPSLIYGRPEEAFMFQLRRRDCLLAHSASVDSALTAAALKTGLRVFVTGSDLVHQAVLQNPSLRPRWFADPLCELMPSQ